MSEYRLSRQAEADLLTIYASTEAKFGKYQADAYHAGFERIFGLLADFSRMGTSSTDERVAGFRRFHFHYIFYTENNSGILIRGLIHVKMNLAPGGPNFGCELYLEKSSDSGWVRS